ncbi:MAG: zinc dependent phospholipase C family protein [Bacteroidales bacterium]|nr:zinc dependent phospholipase C family protein [Bacteroidales bacterium]
MRNDILKHSLIFFLILSLVFAISSPVFSWGFFAHRKINRMAVFTLPPSMIGLFKRHIEYITEHSIDPDKRAHAVEGEAPKHYMDIEAYEDNIMNIPVYWQQAVDKYTEDTLNTHGLLPYNIYVMYFRLRKAFEEESLDRILFNAANIGHYIADANTPLHNTKFYNGRIPVERGIHAFWETRLPLLYAEEFDFFVGRVSYIEEPQQFVWQLVRESNAAVDTIYMVLDQLKEIFSEDKMYTFEMAGQTMARQYSEEYSAIFNERLNNMVERQMMKSIDAVGSFWYTAWVDAGQPDLQRLFDKEISEQLKEEDRELDRLFRSGTPKGRPNPEESIQ